MRHRIIVPALALLAACSVERVPVNAPAPAVEARATFEHGPFSLLLRKHVDEDGKVDYAALGTDRAKLDAYLASLATVDPERLGSLDEKKAFFINAYNAATLAGVLRFMPIASVKDVPSFFTRVSVRCGATELTLDEIEHRKLRPMRDPRIHMAIVCASRSCPRLRNSAFFAEHLDAQLDERAREFLASTERNVLDDRTKTARLSSIFLWFADDFPDVRAFVRRHSMPRDWLLTPFKVEYLEYDWRLNGRP